MRRWNILFLVIGLAGLVVMLLGIDFGRMQRGIGDLGFGLAVAIAVHGMVIFLDSLTMLLCTSRPLAQGLWPTYRAFLGGHAVNLSTPLNNLGELTKYTLLAENMPSEEAAAGLLLQNVLAFLSQCVFIATLGVLAPLLLHLEGPLALGLHIASGVFVGLGVAVPLLLGLGRLGQWPFRLARRLGVSERRVARARDFVSRVAREIGRFRAGRPRLALAVLATIASRLGSAVEIWVMFTFLHIDGSVAVPLLVSAWGQMISWIFAFVPMGVGSAEGGAYVLFRLLGLDPGLGVVIELARKAVRLVFIVVGVALLGLQTLLRARSPGPTGETMASP